MSDAMIGPRPQGDRMLTVAAELRHYPDGVGAVRPTGEVSDAELKEAALEAQKPVAPEHQNTAVCIDERDDVEGQPVRFKMAGGNTLTAYVAAELAGWSLFSDDMRRADPEQRIDMIGAFLVANEEVLGGHIDNHCNDSKTGCGAADNLPKIIENLALHGQDEQFVAQMRDIFGDDFSEELWASIVHSASLKVNTMKNEPWSGHFVKNTIQKYNGVLEELVGDNKNPAQDPDNNRHNHWGEGVVVNKRPGYSNDRDGARIPFFQADVPKIVELCQKMAATEQEFARLVYAAAGFQLATRFTLTGGQRNVTIGD